MQDFLKKEKLHHPSFLKKPCSKTREQLAICSSNCRVKHKTRASTQLPRAVQTVPGAPCERWACAVWVQHTHQFGSHHIHVPTFTCSMHVVPHSSLLSLAHSYPAGGGILTHIPESWGNLAQHPSTLTLTVNDSYKIKIPICPFRLNKIQGSRVPCKRLCKQIQGEDMT